MIITGISSSFKPVANALATATPVDFSISTPPDATSSSSPTVAPPVPNLAKTMSPIRATASVTSEAPVSVISVMIPSIASPAVGATALGVFLVNVVPMFTAHPTLPAKSDLAPTNVYSLVFYYQNHYTPVVNTETL